ncbi:hypothetical protein F4778DRAFT_412266 [Xylariomycetidae sp. FL2044]|nr:hypothetical protein F4778DRAFT_412266 [Xylariomycetidae sp. FL2044]
MNGASPIGTFQRSLERAQLPWFIIGGILLTFFIISLYSLPGADYPLEVPFVTQQQPVISPQDAAGNSTLGFQKLLALSVRPSWRTRGLEAASRLTGLDFTIPPQVPAPEEVVRAFQGIGADSNVIRPEYGSAQAWLAHLDLLRHVVASKWDSAFIVEDDVDWDLRIKDQMRLVSDNVRNYTNATDDDPTPYGVDWDVLWLGHCGSMIIEDPSPKPLIYADETRCDWTQYWGWSKAFLRDRLSDGYRQVQMSVQTVCSFGYGVTKTSAPKVLASLAGGMGEAFDVQLDTRCREGKLRCLVVNPQVFHHYEPPSDYGYESLVRVGDGKGEAKDESNFERERGFTGNIVRSARCKALFNDTCMKPGNDI